MEWWKELKEELTEDKTTKVLFSTYVIVIILFVIFTATDLISRVF